MTHIPDECHERNNLPSGRNNGSGGRLLPLGGNPLSGFTHGLPRVSCLRSFTVRGSKQRASDVRRCNSSAVGGGRKVFDSDTFSLHYSSDHHLCAQILACAETSQAICNSFVSRLSLLLVEVDPLSAILLTRDAIAACKGGAKSC